MPQASARRVADALPRRVSILGAAALASGAACSPAPRPEAAPAVEIAALEPAPASPETSASTRPGKRVDPPALVWDRSEPEARERARREHRPMLVYLRADWSAASIDLERGVWSDPAVLSAARAFVAVKIDVTDAEADAEHWAQRYGIRGVPTTVVLDAEGSRVAALHGPFTAEELLRALRDAER